MLVSILLPTKNEDEGVLNSFVNDIHKTLRGVRHEVVIIDKSAFPIKVAGARIVKQTTSGYGNAIVEGAKASKGDVVVTMDADGSHDVRDLKNVINKSKDYDIVMGSRYATGSKTEDKIVNVLASRFFCSFASFVLGLGLKDPMNGFSAIKKNVYESLELHPIGYKVHMETIFKGKKMGFTTSEVPTTFHKRVKGKSNRGFGTREGMRILKYILELRFGMR